VNESDVILMPLPQSDGKIKNRPAVILREMPSYSDFLVCGVSTQLHQCIEGFDELIIKDDQDFVSSGLIADSVIRLGFLAIIPSRKIMGSIGAISPERHYRLLARLSEYLLAVRAAPNEEKK
jgi:mRNA interferase MazF